VNSDGNTVASMNSTSPYAKVWETAVGKNPRTLAQPAPNGDLWVTNQDDATITILDGGTGVVKYTVALPARSRPHGIAFNPAGSTAYVTLEATGNLIKMDAATRTITGTVAVRCEAARPGRLGRRHPDLRHPSDLAGDRR
jgi:DNA-binding beta-propeller fold protein YncE